MTHLIRLFWELHKTAFIKYLAFSTNTWPSLLLSHGLFTIVFCILAVFLFLFLLLLIVTNRSLYLTPFGWCLMTFSIVLDLISQNTPCLICAFPIVWPLEESFWIRMSIVQRHPLHEQRSRCSLASRPNSPSFLSKPVVRFQVKDEKQWWGVGKGAEMWDFISQ